MKLLIVDDSAMVRRLIEAAYRGSVFTEIQTAADGMLAVTMYKQFEPDVVTLDITMPHMDGLAALKQILEYNSTAKVLVISALADHHTAIESLKCGASQFICKPFSSDDLKVALDEVMNPPSARRSRRRRPRPAASPPTSPPLSGGGNPGVPSAPSGAGIPPAAPLSPPPAPPSPGIPPVSNLPVSAPIAPGATPLTPVSATPPPAPVLPNNPIPMHGSGGQLPHAPQVPDAPQPPQVKETLHDIPSPENYPSGYVRPPVKPPVPLAPPTDSL